MNVPLRKPDPMSWSHDSEQFTRNISLEMIEREIRRGIALVATECIVFQCMFSISISEPPTRISNINSPGKNSSASLSETAVQKHPRNLYLTCSQQ